ncbi:MAG: iron-siderophore ABC transporter substrate-binding protein [Tessaracoccus sp.]|uniref:iron-siderophore ABC transporter substrate-binding protein n=1 Tax=Tessaracoccus sp. TaxID=1971211 RepID=UPI001EBD8451|nr:iron-siderophore ABC transporter substrate-binding protein [Tessaracoccus sp.]MBK7819841.1 iron-siderophore ABC transporter substrate-binding protein [Tessaracoccus sp.]
MTTSWRVLACATLALALAACGGAPAAPPGGPTSTPPPSAGGAVASGLPGIADGTPVRVIEDVDRKPITVPADPQRVVTLSEPTLDGALALGVKPVGSVNGRGQSTMPNYLIDLADGIPTVGTVAQFNFEAIAQLKPDLILTYASGGNNPESVAILEQIAPVYFVGYAGADWRATFANVANSLNKADEGAALLGDFDAYADGVKTKLYAAGFEDKTFSIVRWQGSNASLILKDLPPGMALETIGLKRPPAQDKEGRGHSEPISLENLSDADADYMFFGTLGGSSVGNPDAGGTADVTGAEKAYAEAEGVPGFRELKAYRDDHVILVDGSLWTSTGGPILMRRIIEFVEKELL